MEGNIVERPHKGTPQRGVISPILANIYFHYILNMWFEKVVKSHVEGESMMIALEKRFQKFGLELVKEKTKLIKFSRFSKEKNGDFDFLGFTFKWRDFGKKLKERYPLQRPFIESLNEQMVFNI